MGNLHNTQIAILTLITGTALGMFLALMMLRNDQKPTFNECVTILSGFDNRLKVCELLEGDR